MSAASTLVAAVQKFLTEDLGWRLVGATAGPFKISTAATTPDDIKAGRVRVNIDFDPWARTVDLLGPLPRRYECNSCKRAVTTEDGQLPSGWVERSKVIPGVGPLATLCTNLCGSCS